MTHSDVLEAVTSDAGNHHSPIIDEISVRSRHLVALLEECSLGPCQTLEDLSALAWILQCLDDIEATITRLSLPPLPTAQKAETL